MAKFDEIDIRQKLQKLSEINPTSQSEDKAISKVREMLTAEKNKKPKTELWRKIMRSSITKLATAAVFIIAAAIGIAFFEGTTTSAYALQDTINAYSSVRWLRIHQTETFFQLARTADVWLGCDEKGNVNRMRFQSGNVGVIGPLTIAGDSEKSETWLPACNLKMIGEGYSNCSVLFRYDVTVVDPKFLFESVLEQKNKNEAIIDIDEPQEKSDPIIVTVTYPKGSRSENWKKILYIDQATKLVTKIEKFRLTDKAFQHVKTLELFGYNDPIDPGKFTIDNEVSSAAMVTDIRKFEVGLPQGNMTREEVATKVTQQFVEALIAKDFNKAGLLYNGAPGWLIEKFSGSNIVKIISTEPAHPDSEPDSNAMVSSCKLLVEFGGQYYEANETLWVIPIGRNMNRWSIGGDCTNSIIPASGTVTISRDGANLEAVTYNGLKPGEFMNKWLVLGPLPYPAGTDFTTKERQKAAFDIDSLDSLNFTPKVKIDDIEYEWAMLESEYGIEDLTKLSKEKCDFKIAYAWAQIDMPQETQGILGIGSDDGVKVWLNGELVHNNWLYRPVAVDNDRVAVTFKKGKNQLVIKVQNILDPWGFCCRFLEK